jgi:hypothetical protein
MENYNKFLPEDYQQNEIKPNGIVANILGFVIFIILAPLFGFIYYQIWGTFGFEFVDIPVMQRIINSLIVISILVAFLLVHEMIHGIYWSKYTDAKINVILKSLYRVCYCDEPIKIKNYIIGLIMPAVILGMIPLIIGMIIGNIIVFGFGILFIVVGADDFMVIYLLRKENKNNWVKDMDKTIGFIVYIPQK